MPPYTVTLAIRCPHPECAERAPQSTTFVRTGIKKQLEADEEIKVGGFQCGHSWTLSKSEKESARRAIALIEGTAKGVSEETIARVLWLLRKHDMVEQLMETGEFESSQEIYEALHILVARGQVIGTDLYGHRTT